MVEFDFNKDMIEFTWCHDNIKEDKWKYGVKPDDLDKRYIYIKDRDDYTLFTLTCIGFNAKIES